MFRFEFIAYALEARMYRGGKERRSVYAYYGAQQTAKHRHQHARNGQRAYGKKHENQYRHSREACRRQNYGSQTFRSAGIHLCEYVKLCKLSVLDVFTQPVEQEATAYHGYKHAKYRERDYRRAYGYARYRQKRYKQREVVYVRQKRGQRRRKTVSYRKIYELENNRRSECDTAENQRFGAAEHSVYGMIRCVCKEYRIFTFQSRVYCRRR